MPLLFAPIRFDRRCGGASGPLSGPNAELRHLFLIDGSGFIFRAYHALPPMTRPDGTPVNAVYGYTSMLMRLIEDTEADHLAVVFDTARKTFRNDIYPEYKANRPPVDEELVPQFELVREATRAMGLACVEMAGFEADDLIATYAAQAEALGADVTIVSSDKDLMQLVSERVTMYDAMKNRPIGAAEVMEKFGVGPDRVIDVQALAGDSSDNVPGVQGIGVKTAALLVNEYGDLDGVLANAGEIKQPKRRQMLTEQADQARVSRDLVTLLRDAPVETELNSFARRPPDGAALLAFLDAQGFKSLSAKMESRLGPMPASDGPDTDGPAGEAPAPEQQAPRKAATYEAVQDKARLAHWIELAIGSGLVAVDTETTSLDAMQAGLVGVSLSVEAGSACYIPLAHQGEEAEPTLDLGDAQEGSGDAPDQIPMDEALALLKPLLEDPGVLKIGQNIKYDMKVLARHGVDVAPIDDTMVISYVLEGGLHGHGMDELALLHMDHETIKFTDVAGSGKSQVTFDKVPLDKAVDYAAEDAEITLRLHSAMKPRLVGEKMMSVYENLERPLIPILSEMEQDGIRVDGARLKELSADFSARLGKLNEEVISLAGHDFNVGSPKQLGEVLFDEMGLEGGKKTKTGAYGTGADILEDLAAGGVGIAEKVLGWRQLAKLKSTYTDALLEQINPTTGRVHTSFRQDGAATGRLSSRDPNLQNIPVRTEEGRKIRQAFVPAKGCVLLSADYSQIELRLLAHVAGIDALKEAFRDGLDIHAMTASQVFGVPIEGMDPMIRRQAKAINFGIIYGISAFGLARQLGITRPDAQAYITAYFERYPGILDYMERAKTEARDRGYVSTLYGRKCFQPGIKDKNVQRRNFAERAAINAPIQGGAADIIKRAMARLPKALANAGLGGKMLLQVHDELIFDVPEDEKEETAALARQVMEQVARLDVPLIVDTGLGANWDEAH